ncbi:MULTISPECIES: hypothetical protein [Vibrio]|uniref:hypothetical protein n=1 Tax=Vibrio TaxID=662 RepID=UPI001CC70958|nr:MULTISPECIES: hypothetical protein [Vibrio]
MFKKIIVVVSVMMSVHAHCSEYNRTFYTYSDEQNTVKVAKVYQTIHYSSTGIWFLKQSFSYVSGRGSIPTSYKCFNGYPYDPIKNKSQAWLNTDSALKGCERAKQEALKQADL